MDETQPQERDQIREKLEAALTGVYAVQSALGEGGMAFVYLANDVKHDRQVAIKVLKPELAASLGAERFLREIQITAKLQHPNILPLYDSGEADGLLYYVMPFVVGESLSDLIARERQLSIHDAVQITREVAEALANAHSFGLIHRDIKPDNVMMSNGHAIVADFGIARAMSEAGADKLTQTGMAVGTPAYMSPEQAAGDSGVDARADIYSLGCVFYEMLVGEIPFTGPNAMAIMARHSMDNITAPSIMRQTIPPEVEDVIYKAMEKLPADRYRTAHEMVEDLKAIEQGRVSASASRASQMGMRQSQMGVRRSPMEMRMSRMGMRASQMGMDAVDFDAVPQPRRWPLYAGIGGATVAALAVAGWLAFGRGGAPALAEGGLDPRDVAVLYFDDNSNDGSLGYVADGITDGLIDQLGSVQGLTVVSRNGVAPWRGSAVPYDSIGRALQVGSIVVGGVGASGGNVNVSVRLVDGNSGADLGSRASFQMPAGNLLAARDSAIGVVAELLRERIGGQVRTRETQAGTRSVPAWTLVQRGTRVRADAEGEPDAAAAMARLAEADSLLQLAAEADRDWPEPLIQRGWVALERAQRGRGRAAAPAFDSAIGFADAVLQIDPRNAKALELRGTTRFRYYEAKITDNQTAWQRLLDGAKEDLEAVVGANPNIASAQLTLSVLYYYFDDVRSALLAAQRAYEADAYLERAEEVIDRIFFGSLDLEDFGTAERWCLRGAARFPRDPRFVICQLFLQVTPEFTADVARDWQLVARLDTLEASAFARAQARVLMGGVLAREGLLDSAQSVWLRGREQATAQVDPGQILPALEAYTRTLAGDMDEAIDLLKRAVLANPDHDFANTAGRYWWWRDLRQHPRWREIAGRQ
ncbi:MAG: serine/threonine-protein kinase [Gemmatimonadota bacterium]|nr:serine/threonine-protein kinase [Gemmatimonadota bacterium]